MPIIIEGPDGAGKPTLAKSLSGALDMNILKMTANGGQSAREYEQKLACDGVIIDRCRVSEQVYSDLFGREPRIDHDDAEYADAICPNITEIYVRYRDWAKAHDNAIVLEDDNPATAMVEVLKCML